MKASNDYFGSPLRPGTLEDLFVLLQQHELDERYASGPGRFAANVRLNDGTPAVRYFGNFVDVSWGFSFTTSDAALIEKVNAAMRTNAGYQRSLLFGHGREVSL